MKSWLAAAEQGHTFGRGEGMRKQKLYVALVIVLLMMAVTGCGSQSTLEERLRSQLGKVTSYQCSYRLTYFLPGGVEENYLVDQWVADGQRYRIEIKDSSEVPQQILVSDGQALTVKQASLGFSYVIPEVQAGILGQDLLAARFLGHLLDAGLAQKPEKVILAGSSAWLLDLEPGKLCRDYDIGQRLWLDTRKLTAKQMELYNLAGQVMARLVFTRFQYNESIAPERFVASTLVAGYPVESAKIGVEDIEALKAALPFRYYQPRQLPAGAKLNLVTVVEEAGAPMVLQNFIWKNKTLTLVERPVHDLTELRFGSGVKLSADKTARLMTTGVVHTLFWRNEDVELILSGCFSEEELISFAKSIY